MKQTSVSYVVLSLLLLALLAPRAPREAPERVQRRHPERSSVPPPKMAAPTTPASYEPDRATVKPPLCPRSVPGLTTRIAMANNYRFCPACSTPLEPTESLEDGGLKTRLRCPACGWTHWNNPTPVLAAIIECADQGGKVLLARNAAWSGRMFALITGFMEAGETPEEGKIGRASCRERV